MKYSLKKLWKNINFLMKNNLKETNESLRAELMDYIEDVYFYEIKDKEYVHKKLNVLDSSDTIQLLHDNLKSFCRLGDGEIELMKGNDIQFQKYDFRLAQILLEILVSDDKDFYVGLPRHYFIHPKDNEPEFTRQWNRLYVPGYRRFFIEHCNPNRLYIDAAFNQISIGGGQLNEYYNKIKDLFKDKELVIFAGEGILDKLDYDIFELATSKEYVYGPSKNAFSQFDFLFDKALKYNNDKILVFILGPCSKALCYKLSKEGKLALDLGHLAKAYDFYMKNVVASKESIEDFYRAD